MDKSIKLSVLCIVFGLVSIQTHAKTKDEVRFGVKGGINTSTSFVSLSPHEYYTKYNIVYKYILGFNVGVLLELPLTKTLSLQPELTFTVKGMRNKSFITWNQPPVSGYDAHELQTMAKISLYYIEFPLYLKFDFDLNNSSKLITGIGPYFAYAINGKMNCEFVLAASRNHWIGEKNIFKDDDINLGKSIMQLGDRWSVSDGEYLMLNVQEPYWHKSVKRFDGGISGFIGCELHSNWIIAATYNIGLINFLNPVEKWGEKFESKMYNRTFSISLGYIF